MGKVSFILISNKNFDHTRKDLESLRIVLKEESFHMPESNAIEQSYEKESERLERLEIAFWSPVGLLLVGRNWGKEIEKKSSLKKNKIIDIGKGNWRQGYNEDFKIVFTIKYHLSEVNRSISLLRDVLNEIKKDGNPCVREEHFSSSPPIHLTLSFSDPESLLEIGRIWGQAEFNDERIRKQN